MHKAHNQECPAEALTKYKWKPNTKLNLIKSGFMFRFKSVLNARAATPSGDQICKCPLCNR